MDERGQAGGGDALTPARLVAIAEASALKARYFRLMDRKQWDDWEALFTSDAEMDVRGEGKTMARLGQSAPDPAQLVWRGARAVRDAVSGALGEAVTVHHGHMGEFAFAGEDTIEAVWAMVDRIRYPAAAASGMTGFDGYGHYHDTYARTATGWRIARVELRRLLIEPVFEAPPAGRKDH